MANATLIQHKHCPACGKAILPSRLTCEGECEARFARTKQTRKMYQRLMIAAILLNVALVVVYLPR